MSLSRWITAIAVGCILVGALTIAWGIARDRNETARFLSTQEQLTEAFGAFNGKSTPDAAGSRTSGQKRR